MTGLAGEERQDDKTARLRLDCKTMHAQLLDDDLRADKDSRR